MCLYTRSLFVVTLILTTMLGCGDSASSLSNQKTVKNLSALMSSHPEFSRANLKQIKDAAEGNNATVSVRRQNVFYAQETGDSLPGVENSLVLDSIIAGQAQMLIEQSIKNFDFMAMFDASIKITGISINMQNDMMDRMNKSFGGKGGLGDTLAKQETYNFAHKPNLSCEDFVNNPMIDFGRDELDATIAANKEQMLETLSGCPELKGGQFVRCMNDLNTYMSLINEHASCSIKNMRDLKTVVEEKTGINLNNLELDISRCMKQQFKSCGYDQREVNDKRADTPDNLPNLPTSHPPRDGRLDGEGFAPDGYEHEGFVGDEYDSSFSESSYYEEHHVSVSKNHVSKH